MCTQLCPRTAPRGGTPRLGATSLPPDAPEYEEKGGLKLSERRTAISVGRWTGLAGLGWPAGSRLFHRASFLTGRRPVPWPEGCGG